MIYLAAPYSDPDYTVREARYRVVRNLVFRLAMQQHIYVFSPVVYAHRAADELTLPTDAASWQGMNLYYQRFSSELWLVPIPGWEKSKGVKAELALAKSLNQPIRHITPMGVISDPKE